MELVKKILDLLISFFQSKKATTEQENRVADDAEVAVTEKVRATSNAKAVESIEKAQEALKQSQKRHEQQYKRRSTDVEKTQEEKDDEQFNSDW